MKKKGTLSPAAAGTFTAAATTVYSRMHVVRFKRLRKSHTRTQISYTYSYTQISPNLSQIPYSYTYSYTQISCPENAL
jgi:hypothetical protein